MPIGNRPVYHESGRTRAQRGAMDPERFRRLSPAERAPLGFGVASDAALVGGVSPSRILEKFWQTDLPGVIRTLTYTSPLEEIVGKTRLGDWSDEEIVIQTRRPVGRAQPYTDHSNVPLVSYAADSESRGVMRFESGFTINELERQRQSRVGIDDEAEKRRSMTEALRLSADDVGWRGYQDSDRLVFGLLNDPNLPAYKSNPAGKPWLSAGVANATFAEIIGDLTSAVVDIRAKSGNILDPKRMPSTLVLPEGYQLALEILSTTVPAMSVGDWLEKNYPQMRVVFSQEFIGANASANVFYLFVDQVPAEDDFGGATFVHIVPTDFVLLGREQHLKGITEAATNATAGVFVTRPYAVHRGTGI